MVARKFFSILLLVLATVAQAGAPETLITRATDNAWQLTYQLEEPATEIRFSRNPDDSRVQRWKSLDDSIQIRYENGVEVISRKDGAEFTQASFSLTPTYTHLPKDYAPFSPFSDDGILFHSGRFFACAGPCNDHNQWPITLRIPEGEIAIIEGEVVRGEHRWIGSDSGFNVYVGASLPEEGPAYLSLLDPALPDLLRELLADSLPVLIEYFSAHLPQPTIRPLIYASYSDPGSGRYGRQGGVLPGQIFMHWYGENAFEFEDETGTLLFFAHEVAHFFQGRGMDIEDPQDFWVHEGGAEFMAAYAAAESLPGGHELLNQKLTGSREQCLAGLQDQPGFQAAAAGNFSLHYACGLLIHQAVSTSAARARPGSDIFDVWNAYLQPIDTGKDVSAETYLAAARPFIDEGLFDKLEVFVGGGNLEFGELPRPRTIALTFDDATRGDGPVLTGRERTEKLIAGLAESGVDEAMFFVTTRNVESEQNGSARLRTYTTAGHSLANHSHSHQWLHKIPTQDYVADLDQARKILKTFEHVQPYYRFPFLDEGRAIDKRDALREALSERGLKNGYVTVDTYDWYLDRLLAEASEAGASWDRAGLRDLYVDVITRSSEFYDDLALRTLGRSPHHVLLLHENDVAALFITDLVDELRNRGFQIIPASEAFKDPIADREPDTLFLGQGRIAALADEKGVPRTKLRSPTEDEDYLRRRFETQVLEEQ